MSEVSRDEFDDLRHQLEAATAQLRALDKALLDDDEDDGDEDTQNVVSTEPVYPDVFAWVEHVFSGLAAGPVTTKWCPQWWRHDAVLTRVNAMWRAWEQANAALESDSTAIEAWIRESFDHHSEILFATAPGLESPFHNCVKGHSDRHAPRQLPLDHEVDADMILLAALGNPDQPLDITATPEEHQ